MPLLNFDLATTGMNQAAKLRILKRHFLAFIRHVTVKKFLNFLLTEYNMFQKMLCFLLSVYLKDRVNKHLQSEMCVLLRQ